MKFFLVLLLAITTVYGKPLEISKDALADVNKKLASLEQELKELGDGMEKDEKEFEVEDEPTYHKDPIQLAVEAAKKTQDANNLVALEEIETRVGVPVQDNKQDAQTVNNERYQFMNDPNFKAIEEQKKKKDAQAANNERFEFLTDPDFKAIQEQKKEKDQARHDPHYDGIQSQMSRQKDAGTINNERHQFMRDPNFKTIEEQKKNKRRDPIRKLKDDLELLDSKLADLQENLEQGNIEVDKAPQADSIEEQLAAEDENNETEEEIPQEDEQENDPDMKYYRETLKMYEDELTQVQEDLKISSDEISEGDKNMRKEELDELKKRLDELQDDVTAHLKAKKDQNNAEFKEFVVVKPEETKDTKTKDSKKTEDAKQTMELSDTQKEEQLSDINKMITDLNKIKDFIQG